MEYRFTPSRDVIADHALMHKLVNTKAWGMNKPWAANAAEFHGARLEAKYGNITALDGTCKMCNKPFREGDD